MLLKQKKCSECNESCCVNHTDKRQVICYLCNVIMHDTGETMSRSGKKLKPYMEEAKKFSYR